MKYPANYVDDDGWAVIFEGHEIDRDWMAEQIALRLGQPEEGQVLVTEQEYLDFVPRIKHCSKLTGWGCDQEGEWHGHWVGVQPNPKATDIEFTIARWGRAPVSSE